MIYVLMNPKANNGQGEKTCKEWATCLNDEVVYINVLENGNMKELLLSLDEKDEIVVTGGDGTLNHFVNDVYNLKLKNKMYYVKSGSGNDFYRDNKEYVDELGRIELNRFLDNLPLIKVNGIEKRFLNGIGYGLDGETCRVGEKIRMNTSKRINYKVIALKLLLKKFKQRHAKVIVDGVINEYDNVWAVATMKGKYYGGGVKSAPKQDRFDPEGKVSVVCLHKKSRIGTLIAFPTFSKGKYDGKKWASVVTGKNIEIIFDKPCALQIDGEVVENVTSYIVEISSN